ncbi:MAG TPA: murein biosynthesis integral membrane protein MurJ [Alphaproteobacteria bacterium]|nr:murein biosynthesis integral membrane protein MurJ [Alphaproteobacteria bacterium]
MNPPPQPPQSTPSSTGHMAFLVAAGIFLSRIAGLVRERVISHFLGNSFAADAFRGALKIPNFLQNLFGEGVLSASFIPVYAKLVAQGDEKESGRVAGAIFSLLALVVAVLVLGGVLATPYVIDAVTPGFKGETRALTIRLVRILFPGVGLLVISAWCLGILNSHRRFFLSYASPVAWNAAIIGAVLIFARHLDLSQIAVYAAWGSVVGCGLQVAVQLPVVLRLVPALRLSFGTASSSVRTVTRNFVPVFISRGVNQLSGYVDQWLASFLTTGAVSGLSVAQALYMLPMSLFGMSISAAELPAMSSALGNDEQIAATLRERISASTRRIAFFVVPSALGLMALGDVITAALYQTGRFTHADSVYVWGILAGSGVGLTAATVGRLYTSAFYALRDTRTPLKIALLRVTLTTVLGYFSALHLPGIVGLEPRWGVAGLTASAGFAAWIEFLLLRRSLTRRIGAIEVPVSYFAKIWTAAIAGGVLAWGVKFWLHPTQPQLAAAEILVPYALAYLGVTLLLGLPEAGFLAKKLGRMLG